MPVRLFSAAINGIDAQLIEVEADASPGLHSFNIVGLPDKAVQESSDRISSAIKNSGLVSPSSTHKKILVNLAPADIKKEGPSYDLPIAVSYLSETDQVKFNPEGKIFAGELSLDGTLKHINGVLSMAIMAKKLGFKELIVPHSNTAEARIIKGICVIGAKNIGEVVGYLNGTMPILKIEAQVKAEERDDDSEQEEDSLGMIMGQEMAKRALAIAAAGFHNIIMTGPPGSGKTLLAKALADLMPKMTVDEAIEVARIYSTVGLFNHSSLSFRRPFRSPHHTTSTPAMVGGGTWPKPGEISLAHRGVLFLDELPEFPRNVLESLRQPIEDGTITVSRASGSITLPAKFTLVAAMNPCPCGNFGNEKTECICPPFSIIRYRKKISGPLLDRIDIQINVPRETIRAQEPVLSSRTKEIRGKINSAREIQSRRFGDAAIFSNSEINHKNINKFCPIEDDAEELLKYAVNSKKLSLRAYHKIKKLARTIADLELSGLIKKHHVAEAISLRVNEQSLTNLV